MYPRITILPVLARRAAHDAAREATQAERKTFRDFLTCVMALFAEDASRHHVDCQCAVCSFEGFGKREAKS